MDSVGTPFFLSDFVDDCLVDPGLGHLGFRGPAIRHPRQPLRERCGSEQMLHL